MRSRISLAIVFYLVSYLFSASAYANPTNFVTIAEYKMPMPSADIPGNIQNVTLSAQKVNEVVVNPGEVFSYNKVVGPRTLQKGFAWSESIAWTGSKYSRIKDVGGGVCRTSTAIHQAVKLAGLQVLERHNHSLPVEYAVQGNDAAVWYGLWDYRFQNNKDKPIKVETTIKDKDLIVTIAEANPYTVLVEGKPVELNGVPFINNGQLNVPLRSVAEAMGARVIWNQINQIALLINNAEFKDLPLSSVKGVTYIPIQSLSKLAGYQVTWDDITKTVGLSATLLGNGDGSTKVGIEANSSNI